MRATGRQAERAPKLSGPPFPAAAPPLVCLPPPPVRFPPFEPSQIQLPHRTLPSQVLGQPGAPRNFIAFSVKLKKVDLLSKRRVRVEEVECETTIEEKDHAPGLFAPRPR